MKSLLSVTADTKPGEKEVSGEILAIRGGRPLTGRVEVKGAKNLATKAMVAALLGETTSVLRDTPAAFATSSMVATGYTLSQSNRFDEPVR